MTKKSPNAQKKRSPTKPAKDFSEVFSALQEILQPYEEHLSVVPYRPGFYCLQTRKPVHKGRPVWFAAIGKGKNYVGYHLMPVDMDASMKKRIPAELKKRMQGKACFNLTEVHPVLLRQLADLTAAGFEGYRALKYI